MELTEKVKLKNEEGKVFFELQYQPYKKQLYTTWLGWVPISDILKGLEQQLIWIETHNQSQNCKLMINDCTQVEGAWGDIVLEMEKANLMERWESVAAPIRYNANIQNEDVFNNVSADIFANDPNTSRYAQTYIFNSVSEAEEWFKKM